VSADLTAPPPPGQTQTLRQWQEGRKVFLSSFFFFVFLSLTVAAVAAFVAAVVAALRCGSSFVCSFVRSSALSFRSSALSLLSCRSSALRLLRQFVRSFVVRRSSVRCSLFVVRCSLFVVRCSLFVVRCSSVRCSLFVVRRRFCVYVDRRCHS